MSNKSYWLTQSSDDSDADPKDQRTTRFSQWLNRHCRNKIKKKQQKVQKKKGEVIHQQKEPNLLANRMRREELIMARLFNPSIPRYFILLSYRKRIIFANKNFDYINFIKETEKKKAERANTARTSSSQSLHILRSCRNSREANRLSHSEATIPKMKLNKLKKCQELETYKDYKNENLERDPQSGLRPKQLIKLPRIEDFKRQVIEKEKNDCIKLKEGLEKLEIMEIKRERFKDNENEQKIVSIYNKLIQGLQETFTHPHDGIEFDETLPKFDQQEENMIEQISNEKMRMTLIMSKKNEVDNVLGIYTI